MLILGKLEAFQFDPEKNSHGKERKREAYAYSFKGQKICETAFRVIHCAGLHYMRNLRVHFKKNGAVPRVHGNKGRLPKNVTPFDVAKGTVDFICNFASRNAIQMPAAPGRSKGIPPVFLPSDMSKKKVFELYTAAEAPATLRKVSYCVFCSLWRHCLPHIQVMGIKTDVCDTCRKLRDKVSDARTEDEKIETSNALVTHVTDSRSQRDKYLDMSDECRVQLEALNLLDVDTTAATYTPPQANSVHLTVHYTFDYAQPVVLPHMAQQIGPLYFLSLYKIQVKML